LQYNTRNKEINASHLHDGEEINRIGKKLNIKFGEKPEN
tara:strand:+ start:71 stop:187 length:117 start_codon:yes stop_codon:yes gene_type:complete